MRAYALIPARSGSKGVPNKNVQMINGHPLLAYAVAFGRALGVEQVILSTDSPDYARIGEAYGALVPGLRSAHASRDAAREEEIITELCETLPARGLPLPDVWVRLKPTNPFRRVETVQKALSILADVESADSVRIVSPEDARLVGINSAGFLEPIDRKLWPESHSVVPRNWFPDVYSPFNLDLFRHRLWEERYSAYMGERIVPLVEHKITGLDIDTQDDLDIIRSLIEAQPRSRIVADYIVDPVA